MSPAREPDAEAPPLINGRYRVLRELGRGGMGQVYLVEDTHRENLTLALKTILAKSDDARFLEDFKIEFSELAKLSHPNVAAAYDFGTIAGTRECFFTTEFVRGVELFQGTDKLNLDQLLDITAQLLRGLEFIHSLGLLHNDLKPQNVLLEARAGSKDTGGRGDMKRLEATIFGLAGRVKLIDFGLLSGENVAWQRIRGTPRYVSPERIRLQPADRRSDLYSLGCVLYVLFARRPPFSSKDTRALLKMHLESPPPPITGFRADLPAPVVQLIHRLLEKRREDRYESAQAALRFLGGALGWDASIFEQSAKTPEVVAGSLLFRENEVRFLEEAFEEAARGEAKSPAVCIEGAEGVGKSALVNELRTVVQVRGGAFVEIAGQSIRRHLQPILDAVIGDLKRSGARGVDEMEKSIIEAAGTGSAALDLTCALDRIIFSYAARMPVVIHFDDFQHASPTVRRFAIDLIHSAYERLERKEARPRLLVLVSRDNRSLKTRLDVHGLKVLALEAFSEETACELVRRVYGQTDVPAAVLRGLAAISQGNPRLLLELARSLVSGSLVKYDGARWVFPPSLAGISLPGTLADSMAARLAALGSQASAILEWIAACRLPPAASLLKRCTFLGDEVVDHLLRRLVAGGLLTEEEVDGRAVYDVAHQGLKSAVLERQSEERTKFLHQRLAQSLEEEHGGREPGEDWLSEVLAYHWLEAGNVPGFLRFAERAAAYLQRSGSLELAVSYRRRIAESMPPEATAKKITSLARLSEMHEFLWDLEHAQENLREILDVGAGLTKPTDRLAVLRRLGSIAIARQRHAEALELLGKARALAEPLGSPIVGLSLDAPEAWARWFGGERIESLRLAERAEGLLAAVLDEGGPPLDARAKATVIASMNHLANLYQHLGRPARAIELHQRSLALLAGLGLDQAEAASRSALGSVLLDTGQHAAAEGHLSAALETARRIGDRRTAARARERLGLYHFYYGDLKRALAITKQGLEDARTIKHLPAMANSLRLLGRIYLRANQEEDATEVLQRALAIQRDTGDSVESSMTRIHLARRFVVEGKILRAVQHLKDAEKDAERCALASALHKLASAEVALSSSGVLDGGLVAAARETLRDSGYPRELLDAEILVVRGSLAAGDAEGASAALSRLNASLLAVGTTEQSAEVSYLRARLDILEGRTDDAARAIRELEHWASNNVFPQIVSRCLETSQEISVLSKAPSL
jgi:serine/threonine protein kinase/tetratricopeptide (TPR) repeat protein